VALAAICLILQGFLERNTANDKEQEEKQFRVKSGFAPYFRQKNTMEKRGLIPLLSF